MAVMHSFRAFLLMACCIALPLTACAQPPTPVAAQKLLRSASGHDDFDVIRVFTGPHGLYGVIYKAGAGSREGLVWLTPDGKAVIPGLVIDARRQDLTRLAQVQQGLLMSPAGLWQYAQAPAARSFTLGTAGPLLTAFIDPNCPYCHLLYEDLLPGVASRRIRVRYVLVGIIRPNSAARAASMLAAADITRALAENEARFDLHAEQGAYPIAPEATYAKYMSIVDANNDALQRAGADATPTLVYCDRATHQMTLRSSSESLDSLLQTIADPATCSQAPKRNG